MSMPMDSQHSLVVKAIWLRKTVCQQICKTQASCFNGGAKSNSGQCKQFAACKNLDEYSGYSGAGNTSSPPASGGGVCENAAGLDDNEVTPSARVV